MFDRQAGGMDGNGNAGDREGRNILEDARNALQTGDRAGDGGGRPTRRRTFDGLSELEAALPMKFDCYSSDPQFYLI